MLELYTLRLSSLHAVSEEYSNHVNNILYFNRTAYSFGWCWFVLREKYCWLVASGWFVVREKYCWLVTDKPSEQGVTISTGKIVSIGGELHTTSSLTVLLPTNVFKFN
jgi:hypothetical protein